MTCPPCTHDCDQGDTCPIRVKERERIIAANAPEIEKANAHIKRLEDQAYDLLGQLHVANITLSMRPRRTWVGLMRGVRVEGDTVVITVKGGNDAARELCGALIEEMNK